LSVNIAASISSVVLPMLRNDVKCYSEDCYPLAYGVATIVLIISFVLFLIGSPFYIKNIIPENGENKKKENIMFKTIKCIYSALRNKFKKGKDTDKQHWLEYADQSYSEQLKSEVKILLRVIIVFLPLPIFWGLYEQQYSRWVLQGKVI
jgi:dipeptide/tripeptide permease